MSHNSNHRDAVSVPDHAEVVKPARQLRALHDRDAFWKLMGALLCGLVLLGVSAALSLVTGGVLTRLMPDWAAYLVGTLIHIVMGGAVHLLVIGTAQRNRGEKAWGALCLAGGLVALLSVFVARALVLIEEGRAPASAWTMSGFLLLIECVFPALFGYLLAKAWLARNEAAEEARFYRHHEQLIETSAQPAQRWNDAEDRLADEIAGLQRRLTTAKPEEQVELNAAIARLSRRWNTLKEWNPTRPYTRPAAPAPSLVAAPPLVGRDGQGDAHALSTFTPLVRSQPDKRGDDVTFYG